MRLRRTVTSPLACSAASPIISSASTNYVGDASGGGREVEKEKEVTI